MQDVIRMLEAKNAKLTSRKSVKDFTPIPHDKLVKKCLQFAETCQTTLKMAEAILVDENFDENAVLNLSPRVSKQIESHLNGEPGYRAWNSKYLLQYKHKYKCFPKDDGAKFDKMVTDLLRMKMK